MFDAKELFSINLNAWNKVEKLSISRKEKINTLLGLNEENKHRVFLPITPQHEDIMRTYSITARFVQWVCEKQGFPVDNIDFGTNTLKDGNQERKVTRILSKALGDDRVLKVLEHYKEHIYSELKIENTKQFIPAWGERKVSGYLVISTNIHDLLTPSNNSSFQSCHRIGGEYYNSAMSHAVSECSFITYVTDNKETLKKIGRTWCMLHPSGDCFVHFGSYGTMHAGEFSILEKYVEEKCGEFPVSDFSWKEDNYCGYMDSCTFKRAKKKRTYTFNFHDPICLTCGQEFHETCHNGMCDKCDNTRYCGCCDEWVDVDNWCDECNVCMSCCECEERDAI